MFKIATNQVSRFITVVNCICTSKLRILIYPYVPLFWYGKETPKCAMLSSISSQRMNESPHLGYHVKLATQLSMTFGHIVGKYLDLLMSSQRSLLPSAQKFCFDEKRDVRQLAVSRMLSAKPKALANNTQVMQGLEDVVC